QTLYKEQDAIDRLPKAVAAKRRIAEINSEITVEEHVADVNNSNIESLIDGCDLVIDGTDNFQVRYLVNDACVKHNSPWIYGAAVSSYGTTMTVVPGETPCLRCVFEEMPDAGSAPTCDTAGVIMPIISSIAAVQVAEALKLLTGNRDALHNSLMQIDVWQNDWRKIKLAGPNPDCIACGKREFEFLDADSQEFAAVLCGRDAVQIAPPNPTRIDLKSLAEKLAPLGEVRVNEYLLRFNHGDNELTVFTDGRAIVKGTDDISAARNLYARYVGA
ncbi:MAG: ThiF family adenylyltransferase, partial [bacterium]|nr:ThiF family adenylyltransferase [bacterium]